MTPNWFADGQHILVLAGGAVAIVGQGLTIWRTLVIGQRQTELHNIVQANDKEILGELSAAQRSIDKVVSAFTGRDRRRNSPGSTIPVWANGGRGRRVDDSGPPPAPA